MSVILRNSSVRDKPESWSALSLTVLSLFVYRNQFWTSNLLEISNVRDVVCSNLVLSMLIIVTLDVGPLQAMNHSY